MADEPSWEDIFSAQPANERRSAVPNTTPPANVAVPKSPPAEPAVALSRRELRAQEDQRRSTITKQSGGTGRNPKRKRSKAWIWVLSTFVVILGLGAGAVAFVWLNYEEQVREVLGWELPIDFEGSGNGEEVVVTIQSGDFGSDIAQTLAEQGVTMTAKAFYELLLVQEPEPAFHPGNYALEKEMSAQSALDALLDPENKIVDRLLIREGQTVAEALEILAETTELPLEDFEAAAADHTIYGLPDEAVSLEGYLFPATYEIDGGQSPQALIQMLVDEMFKRLDAAGVAPEDRHRVLTIASLIQREARIEEDFYKVSRVIQNRLDEGMKLQFDSTSHYGAGSQGSVWTTDEERADDNPWNTYVIDGLPIGPIAAPGDVAIDAALNPADGPWLFFVSVNLADGTTVFTETVAEHERAVDQLRAWCRESDENAVYCE